MACKPQRKVVLDSLIISADTKSYRAPCGNACILWAFRLHKPFPIGTWKLWNKEIVKRKSWATGGPTSIALVNGVQVFLVTGAKSICNAVGSQCRRVWILWKHGNRWNLSKNNMKPHVNQICRQICLPLHVYIFIVCSYFICVRSIGLERGFFYVFVVTFVWNQKYSQNWMINTQNQHTKSEFSWPLAVSCISHIFTQWSRSSHGSPSLPHGHPRWAPVRLRHRPASDGYDGYESCLVAIFFVHQWWLLDTGRTPLDTPIM